MKSTHQNLSRNKSKEAPQLGPLCSRLFVPGKYFSGQNISIKMKMSASMLNMSRFKLHTFSYQVHSMFVTNS